MIQLLVSDYYLNDKAAGEPRSQQKQALGADHSTKNATRPDGPGEAP